MQYNQLFIIHMVCPPLLLCCLFSTLHSLVCSPLSWIALAMSSLLPFLSALDSFRCLWIFSLPYLQYKPSPKWSGHVDHSFTDFFSWFVSLPSFGWAFCTHFT